MWRRRDNMTGHTPIERFLIKETVKKVPKRFITLLDCLTTETHARAVVVKPMLGGAWRTIVVDANVEDNADKPTITTRVIHTTDLS